MVLTAEPAPGFELLGWNYGDCSQSENPVCTIDLVYACGVGLNPLPVCIEGETYDAFLQPVFVESDMIADTGWSPESSCLLTIAGDVTCWGPAQVQSYLTYPTRSRWKLVAGLRVPRMTLALSVGEPTMCRKVPLFYFHLMI